jgi:hypothetical protein
MNFLDSLVNAGTAPEIAHDTERVQNSVDQLSGLLARIQSPELQRHAVETLSRLQALSQNESLRQDCTVATNEIDHDGMRPGTAPGVLASPKAPLPPLALYPDTMQ